MSVYYRDDLVTLYHGDCIEVMRSMPDSSVHAVVTDPPYGLEFMGKEWDSFREALGIERSARWAGERSGAAGASLSGSDGLQAVAKLPAYGGKRPTTARCLVCGKRDAFRNGHECGDSAKWITEPVDPNSAPPSMVAFGEWVRQWAAESLRILKPGGHLLAFGGSRTWHRLACGVEDAGFEIRDSIAWLYGSGFPKSLDVSKAIDRHLGASEQREVVGGFIERERTGSSSIGAFSGRRYATAPATAPATAWDGWGTALKPAFEPIVVARKPLVGTVAANVLAYRTGALNIDATRVGDEVRVNAAAGNKPGGASYNMSVTGMPDAEGRETSGRWPTNVVLDESQAAELDRRSGVQRDGVAVKRNRDGAPQGKSSWSLPGAAQADTGYGGEGGASRFFPTFRYEAKAPSSERPEVEGVQHPTVKPLDLMRWLVRLVTPPGGTVLEPFAGSGTTLEAAILEGFNVIGIEREADYLPLIEQRLSKPMQQTLFGDLA